MPANNTTHEHTSIHSQQEEKTRRKCQRTWKSLAFPPRDLLKTHTQQHQKEKIKHPQRLRSAASDKKRLKSTPNITASPSQQKNNKKRDKRYLCTLNSFGLHQSVRLARKQTIATKQQ
jgi:hypothetical protein